MAHAAGGRAMPLTLYVDRFTDMIGSKYEVTLCLPSPYVPQDQGGAAFGANLRQLLLHLSGVYRNGGAPAVSPRGGFVSAADIPPSAPNHPEAADTRPPSH